MKKLIFISCGQQSDEERELGRKVKALVDANPGFEAYFAQSVQSLDSLRDNIFEALAKCSGAIAFLHNRGKALALSGEDWGFRSSVWVNQEIAILAFRQYKQSREIPVLVFKDDKVKLEGAMTAFIINTHPIVEIRQMLDKIREWLSKANFLPGLDEEFVKKWEQLSELSKQVSSCLIDLGGVRVNEVETRNCLISKFSLSNNDATKAIQKAKLEFERTNLVEFERNKEAIYVFNIHSTWDNYLRREILNWRNSSSK